VTGAEEAGGRTGSGLPKNRVQLRDVSCQSFGVAARIVETVDPHETEALAAELAADLGAGDVVLVHGEFGAGKTPM
jgi:hypothetical protein